MRPVCIIKPYRNCLCVLAAFGLLNAAAFGAQVNFETLATGTTFGEATNSPGELLFTQEGINVTGETFHFGSFSDFFEASINAPGEDLFSTKHVFFNNINFGFDLSGVGPIDSVDIEYHEFGGTNNFSVNGGPILELPAMTAMPTNVAPGVTATVDSDSIHLSGVVTSFLIGGQELAIDNVVAVPEPTCLLLLASGLGAALLRRR